MAIIKNEIDKTLQAYSPSRLTVTAVTINSLSSSFLKAKNTNITSPSQIQLTASIVGFTTPTYTWYYSTSTNLSTWIAISTGISLAVTNTLYNTHITSSTGNTFIRYKVVASQTGWTTAETYFDINYNQETNDLPVLTFSKDSIALPTTSADTCTYTGASTDISVSIGGTALSYATTGANTFNVTVGTLIGTGTVTASTVGNIQTYTISGMNGTGLTATLTVPFTITARDARGAVTTFTKNIFVSKVTSGTAGVDGRIYYIDLSTSVITKDSINASTPGTHTAVTAKGYSKVGTALATEFGWITTTIGTGSESARVASSAVTATQLTTTAGVSDVTFRMYDAATGGNYIDAELVPVLFKNSSAISVNLTNDAAVIPTNSAGTSGVYANSGTDIYVYQGATILAYDGVGTAVGTWKIATDAGVGITAAAIGTYTDQGDFVRSGTHSNITSPVAVVTLTITGTDLLGAAFTVVKTQTLARAVAGVDATAVYTATVYYQGGTVPTVTANTGSYTFSTNTLVVPTGNVTWSVTQPATSTTPTYSTRYTFTTNTVGVAVPGGSWSTPVVEAVNGTNGEYRDIIQLYLQSGSLPTKPTSIPYTFSTSSIGSQSGGTAGWSMTMPASSTTPTYLITCQASTTTPATPVTLTAWTNPVIIAKNGSDGAASTVPGPAGDVAVFAYYVISSASLPASPTITQNATPAFGTVAAYSTWYLQPKATLASSDWQFQISGTKSAAGTYTWESSLTGYLSTFKVGALSALSADLGVINAGTISTSGYGVFSGNSGSVVLGALGINIESTVRADALTGAAGAFANRVGILGTSTTIMSDPFKTNIGVAGHSTRGGGQGVSIGVFASGQNWAIRAEGSSLFNGQIRNTTAQGTAPISVDSNTLCSNLNADLLDNLHATDFYRSNNPSGYITSSSLSGYATTSSLSGYYPTSNPSGYLTTSHYAFTSTDHDSRYPHYWPCQSGVAYANNGMQFLSSGIGGVQTRGSGNALFIEAISDRRLKQNIEPEILGVDFINSLTPVSYRLINNPVIKFHGFIAQDLGLLVNTEDDSLYQTHDNGTLGVDYMSLIAPLVKAVQELTLRIKILENI
jgi:hypothetical protein